MKAPRRPARTSRFAVLFKGPRAVLVALAVLASHTFAAPPPAPTVEPEGGNLPAPVKVKVRGATPDTMVHVTLDGTEPTPRDTEVDVDVAIVIDQPLTLKAKAWLPDGSASETKTVVYSLVPAQGNAASFVEQNTPALMVTGNTHPVAVTLRNIGTVPWTPATHSLAPYRTRDAQVWNVGPAPATDAVALWGEATFLITVTAPKEPGTYNLRFQMRANGEAFGEPTPTLRVAVLTPEEFERESGAVLELVTHDPPPTKPRTAVARPGRPAAVEIRPLASDRPATPKVPPPLTQAQTVALEGAKAAGKPGVASVIDRLVDELRGGRARSFRNLRALGFKLSDDEFTKIIAAHPALFGTTRMQRHDEKGNRVIPGWPAVKLAEDRVPLTKAQAAALEKAMVRSTAMDAGEIERLVRVLQHSPHSFRYLRTVGFHLSDSAFAKLVTPHADLFRVTRTIRRDEKGQRVVPGWPGVALTKGDSRKN